MDIWVNHKSACRETPLLSSNGPWLKLSDTLIDYFDFARFLVTFFVSFGE